MGSNPTLSAMWTQDIAQVPKLPHAYPAAPWRSLLLYLTRLEGVWTGDLVGRVAWLSQASYRDALAKFGGAASPGAGQYLVISPLSCVVVLAGATGVDETQALKASTSCSNDGS